MDVEADGLAFQDVVRGAAGQGRRAAGAFDDDFAGRHRQRHIQQAALFVVVGIGAKLLQPLQVLLHRRAFAAGRKHRVQVDRVPGAGGQRQRGGVAVVQQRQQGGGALPLGARQRIGDQRVQHRLAFHHADRVAGGGHQRRVPRQAGGQVQHPLDAVPAAPQCLHQPFVAGPVGGQPVALPAGEEIHAQRRGAVRRVPQRQGAAVTGGAQHQRQATVAGGLR